MIELVEICEKVTVFARMLSECHILLIYVISCTPYTQSCLVFYGFSVCSVYLIV